MAPESAAQPKPDRVTAGFYAVGLIDLLNQGNQLRAWDRFPETEEQRSEFRAALRKTVGVVHECRSAFNDYVRAVYPREPTDWPQPLMTNEQKVEFERLKPDELKCQHFSDTTVLFVPLANGLGEMSAFGLYAMLLGSAGTLLLMLGRGVALRGAVEVAMAIDFFPNEVYGPALLRAHQLEQDVAQYPRIVVGDGAMQFLVSCRANPGTTNAIKLNRAIAEQAEQLIAWDQDGVPFVDYLGAGFRRESSEVDWGDTFRRAPDFIMIEHRRFVEAGDHKLALRYAWLRQYFESRADQWRT
jgi:hypothetical protein